MNSVIRWFSAKRGGALGAASLVALLAALVYLVPAASEGLQYDRAAIAAGQLWRIGTCHLTHWSLDHLFWDAAVFVCLAAICLGESRRATWSCLGANTLAIPASLWLWIPDMATYRGLSGVDSALFALLTVMLIRRGVATSHWRSVVIACGFALAFGAKTVFELVTGTTMFVDSAAAAMVPIPLAHVVGGVLGAMCGRPMALFSVVTGEGSRPWPEWARRGRQASHLP